MEKNESKYFYTAQLMNQALISLLEKKDIEFITVTEITKKAGVNRSTFYLHYENIYELLEETIKNLNAKFINSFNVQVPLKINSPQHAFLITNDFLVPYLNFCKENKRVLRLVNQKPQLFQNKESYQKMYNLEIKNGEIYFRYGGRTQKIQYAELESIINHRIEKYNAQWVDLISKIGKSGPQNAAILDLEKGAISKNDSQILVVDDSLVKGIKWIKEGSFSEKDGAPALKLIGEVQPIETVEVIKKEKINRLKEYPLSATELASSIKSKSDIKQNDIWRIINENKIKDNTDYSIYNFRNKSQEELFEKTGTVPKGVPSIFKETAIDYIIKIYQNEH